MKSATNFIGIEALRAIFKPIKRIDPDFATEEYLMSRGEFSAVSAMRFEEQINYIIKIKNKILFKKEIND